MAPPIIDVHSHWVSSGYVEGLRDRIDRLDPRAAATLVSVRNPTAALTDLDLRVAEMDGCGVGISVLSLPPPGVTVGRPQDRAALARLANDEFLQAASDYPGRLSVLVALPLPDVEGSLAELDRTGRSEWACGVNLQAANGEGWTIDEPAFEAVWRRAAELGLPVLVHPAIEALPDSWSQYRLSASLAPVLSSSLGAARMVLSGLLDRVPDLDLIVPHLGGVLPYLTQRFDDFGPAQAANDFSWYLKNRLYFDTCSYHPPAFQCAVDTCGVGRLVMGTDYPVRGSLRRAVDDVCASLTSEAERAAVLGGTASRWLLPKAKTAAG